MTNGWPSFMRNIYEPTTTVDATVTALQNEAGAIPNEPLKKQKRRRRPNFSTVEVHTVEVVRPAVNPWVCDECLRKGRDFQDMQEHVTLTGHTVFTAR